MKAENINKQLAEKIIDILRSGLTLNPDTLHYIDSTFSNPSIGELEELLQDESSCEADSLIELLFFPDEPVQIQLEEMLAEIRLQKQDEHESYLFKRGAVHYAPKPIEVFEPQTKRFHRRICSRNFSNPMQGPAPKHKANHFTKQDFIPAGVF
jgi:hypothetical protein